MRTAERVAEALRRSGHSSAIAYTTRKGDAEARVEELAANDSDIGCVVACGGDGTIQEVVNGLMKLRDGVTRDGPTLGLAPAGRCNDLARVLGISTDAVSIADTLMCGTSQAIDLGRANGRYYCTVATMGVDAEVSRFVNEMKMPLTGTPAYVYGALRVLARYRAHRVRLEGDFGILEKPILLASTANTSSYGGHIPIVPGANPADGLLDVCIIDAVSRWRAMRLLPRVLGGTHVHLPEVMVQPSRSVKIDAEDVLELWADGERLTTTPATIEVVPAALRVLTPPPGDTRMEKL